MHQSPVISVGERVTSRAALVAHAVETAARRPRKDPELAHLVTRYYRHVDDDDLASRDPDDLLGAVLSHRQLARTRPQGTAAVRAFTPAVETHAWATGTSVIEIVTDDMPFLIDSVTELLDGEGVDLRLLVHPQVVVRRDVTGYLLEVLDLDPNAVRPDQEARRDVLVESWIHLEIRREREQEVLDRLVARLRAVLDDVRICVEDWMRMRYRAVQLASDLREDPPPGISEGDVGQAADLLDWLSEEHFTFLGYREYRIAVRDGQDTLAAVPGTGLGLLRHDQPAGSTGYGRLGPQARAKTREPVLLVLTKANSRSTVHRRAYLDYIGIKVFDASGAVVGERRFLGLFAATAYTGDALEVPVVSDKVAEVLRRSGLSPGSHSGKDLRQILQTYPRDELFQISVDDLFTICMAVLRLQRKRRTRLFVRPDVYGRFVSCLVFLPRDRYTTSVRLRLQQILLDAFRGTSIDYVAMLGDGPLARLQFIVRVPAPGIELGAAGLDQELVRTLEDRIARVARTWEEDLADALVATAGEEDGARCLARWRDGLPAGYKEAVDPRIAVRDLQRFESLDDGDRLATAMYSPVRSDGRAGATGTAGPAGTAGSLRPGGDDQYRLKVFSWTPLALSDVLPYLAQLGAQVVDERPYVLTRDDGAHAHLYDFGLRFPDGADTEGLSNRFRAALAAAWAGDADSDGFGRLVTLAGLTWRQVAVLRTYARYLRQAGLPFGQQYVESCLAANGDLARALVELFEFRFDPGLPVDDAARAAGVDRRGEAIEAALDAVPRLDHDRILRGIHRAVLATVRTNAYAPQALSLAIKLDPRLLPDLPRPRPRFEVFVHAPRVEGVHLRFGHVARGGLRWSDRPEDVRTEVLGLVKAQIVKNAVIVPTGAKGGFVPRRLPDPADRDAWLAEGRACYVIFISALLDLTDNLLPDEGADGGMRVVPPRGVVRHDGDDAYLVVAADKGTATFSDLANEVSARYGHWLGDAFASGGSAGYDHKAMGITARGAWCSVEAHLRTLGRHEGRITTVGIGDMSGDVFGNGMLSSPRIALVAAFDHRHVFLDPDPDPERSYAERRRLFDLPRSSWADYDEGLISTGGGVFPRSAKSVPITPQVARALGIRPSVGTLTPGDLIRAILAAPVDLLWNGGIGTYVKASTENHAAAADKANDGIRIDATELRARIVAEGGNLGLTQAARVEAARGGTLVNTDAIDNSAGVDCSDHEVNLKILLDAVVAAGELTGEERDALLVEMTDDVARLVLQDNVEQNVVLATAVSQSGIMTGVHARFLRRLEEERGLDRALEGLPGDDEIAARAAKGAGLTSPELSVLLAHAKISLAEALLAGDLITDDALGDPATPVHAVLRGYFPAVIGERYGDRIGRHPLRREIAASVLANELVNDGGISFVFRIQEEFGASEAEIARAYLVARDVFGVRGHARAVSELDGEVPSAVQTRLRLAYRRLLDRSVRRLVQARVSGRPVPAGAEAGAVARYRPAAELVAQRLPDLLVGEEFKAYTSGVQTLVAEGVPEPLAARTAGTLHVFQSLDVADLAAALGLPVADVAEVWFAVSDRLRIDALLDRIAHLPRGDRWQALARSALRFDVYRLLDDLTRVVLTWSHGQVDRMDAWLATHEPALDRATRTMEEVLRVEPADLAALSVALRTLRGLAESGAAPADDPPSPARNS